MPNVLCLDAHFRKRSIGWPLGWFFDYSLEVRHSYSLEVLLDHRRLGDNFGNNEFHDSHFRFTSISHISNAWSRLKSRLCLH